MEEKAGKADIEQLQEFVAQSDRGKEHLVVIVRNLTTGRELEVPVTARFITGLFKPA